MRRVVFTVAKHAFQNAGRTGGMTWRVEAADNATTGEAQGLFIEPDTPGNANPQKCSARENDSAHVGPGL